MVHAKIRYTVVGLCVVSVMCLVVEAWINQAVHWEVHAAAVQWSCWPCHWYTLLSGE